MADNAGLAAALDGIPMVADAAARDARFPLATRKQNQRVFRLDLGIQQRWSGSAWVDDTVVTINARTFGAVGDGVTDDATAIQAALTAAALIAPATVVLPASSAAYLVATPLSIPANVDLAGRGTLKAKAGFTARYLILIDAGATGAKCSVAVLDGTNMPAPTGAWTGAGTGTARAPVGCAIFINGTGGGTLATDCVIACDTIQNFPSGPVCAFGADNLLVAVRKFVNNQTYTGGESNGIVSAFDSVHVEYRGGLIDGYAYKGWYFGRCTNSKGINNACKNGGTGMASHYDASGAGNVFLGASHTGTGFGYKAFQTARPQVIGFTSKNADGTAVYFDSTTDAVLDGLTCVDCAKPGIIVQSDTLPTKRTTIRNWHVTRSTPGTTTDHVAILVQPNASGAIDGVDIDAGTGEYGLYGYYCPSVSGATVANVRIGDGVTWTNTVQYDVIGYHQSIDVSGTIVRAAAPTTGVDVLLSTQPTVAGTRCRIGNLSVDMAGSTEIAVDLGGTWTRVSVEGLKTTGGGTVLKADNTSSISHLVLTSVHGYNPAQVSAINLLGTVGKLTVGTVQLPIAAGGARTISTASVYPGFGVQPLTDAATIVVDASVIPYPSGSAQVTLGGNRTMSAPGSPRVGQRITFTIIQDATGGRTLAWAAAFKVSWSDTGNTANKRSSISFVFDGTNWNQDGAQTPYV